MPVDVPTEDYFSLNAVAGFCGMDRQEFRKLVGEFERQAGRLPTRINDEGKDGKFIPSAFVHVFEEAAMWMRVEKTTVADGMAQALNTKRSGSLVHLAATVKDREPMLRLPQQLRTETAALVAAARVQRPVAVNLLDQADVINLINNFRKETRLNWWIVGVTAVLCTVLGAVGGSYRSAAQVAMLSRQVNQFKYDTTKQLNRIEHLEKQGNGR